MGNCMTKEVQCLEYAIDCIANVANGWQQNIPMTVVSIYFTLVL